MQGDAGEGDGPEKLSDGKGGDQGRGGDSEASKKEVKRKVQQVTGVLKGHLLGVDGESRVTLRIDGSAGGGGATVGGGAGGGGVGATDEARMVRGGENPLDAEKDSQETPPAGPQGGQPSISNPKPSTPNPKP